MESPQEYYKGNGPMTVAGSRTSELRAMPSDIAALCQVVQGLLVHRDIASWLYSLKLTEKQRDDANIRPVAQMLARIHALDSRPLIDAREADHRMPSVCRHFSNPMIGCACRRWCLTR